MANLRYLEGKKFCIVFVKVVDPARERFQLQCFRGRADTTDAGRVNVVAANGAMFTLPGSAMASIQPNDGTAILRDAEYFAMVKADQDITFVPPGDGYFEDS